MRFFTAEWWFQISPDIDRTNEGLSVFDAYQKYIASIEHYIGSLPEELRGPCGLHDDGVESIQMELDVVTINLIESERGHPRSLKVSGVRSVQLECWDDIEEGQDPRHHYAHGDDVGYHEIYVDADRNTLTFSAIFHSGTEIEISGYLSAIKFELIDHTG